MITCFAVALVSFLQSGSACTWTDVPSPNLGSPINTFYGVAAIAPTDVWAVGSHGDALTVRHQIQHWNGAAWSISPSPALSGPNELLAVDAISTSDVWV